MVASPDFNLQGSWKINNPTRTLTPLVEVRILVPQPVDVAHFLPLHRRTPYIPHSRGALLAFPVPGWRRAVGLLARSVGGAPLPRPCNGSLCNGPMRNTASQGPQKPDNVPRCGASPSSATRMKSGFQLHNGATLVPC